MEESALVRRGGQIGNQNARKHGFYSPVLDEGQTADFGQATCIEGLDGEIALLRVKIKSLVAHDPDNIELLMRATGMLARLVRTRYNIGKDDRIGLKDALTTVLKDIAVPLGILGAALKR